MDRDNMSTLYRGPSIDTSYQISVHLANVLQRRRLKCEKLTNDGRQMTDDRRCTVDDRRRTPDDRQRTTVDERRTPSDGKSSRCLRQGELKRNANEQYRKRKKMSIADPTKNISDISSHSKTCFVKNIVSCSVCDIRSVYFSFYYYLFIFCYYI